MMGIGDRKKTVSVILSKLGSDGSSHDTEVKPEAYGPDDDSAELRAIAEDVMGAVKSGSVHDLAQSLKAFWAMCEQYEDEE